MNKSIYRYWAGPNPMPSQYVEYGKQWEELNPGWQCIDYGEEILQLWDDLAPVFNHLYERDAGRDSTELHVQVADVVGYALVREFGGVYVNADMQPLQPLEGKIPDQAWASYENEEDWRIVNAAIGSPVSNDPFWVGLLMELPDNYFRDPYDEMVMSTGPGFLTRYANQNRHLINILPKSTFNSVHWKQIADGGDASGFSYPPDALAVHHWGHRKLVGGRLRSNKIEDAPFR